VLLTLRQVGLGHVRPVQCQEEVGDLCHQDGATDPHLNVTNSFGKSVRDHAVKYGQVGRVRLKRFLGNLATPLLVMPQNVGHDMSNTLSDAQGLMLHKWSSWRTELMFVT